MFLVAIIYWRWKEVSKLTLQFDRCENLSSQVLEDLFQVASNAGEQVSISSNYWHHLELSDAEWIYLCRWMLSRGLIITPDGWGWISILLSNPPMSLALTNKSWSLKVNGPNLFNISIGDGNGHINIGGRQNNITVQGLDVDDLKLLIDALDRDAKDLTEPDASDAQKAAHTFSEVLNGDTSACSPKVFAALKWVRERASEAVGAGGGNALWAATVAAGRSLGWF